jgi:hypothetical protein
LLLGRSGNRGKKTRKSSKLSPTVNLICGTAGVEVPYITVKQDHCMPIWAMPKSPAAHSKVLTDLQHATSAREAGKTNMFAKAHVPEVVPRRTKYGEMPSEVLRAIIR